MTIVSYRFYCTNCSNETVIRKQDLDESSWKILSPSSNSGVCESCDKTSPAETTDESDKADSSEQEIDFEKLDAIGETGASNLREAGFVTLNDVKNATNEELLDVSWVGESGVQSIRQKIETFK